VLGDARIAADDRFGQLRENVNEMLARFRRCDFAGASEQLVTCRKIGHGFSLEYLFNLYAERIHTFEENPPPADWNGVFVLETK
jgi:adenylate cyclase